MNEFNIEWVVEFPGQHLFLFGSHNASSVHPASFCWQCSHELHGPLYPDLQLLVVLDALRLDSHPFPHWPAGDVERPNVRLTQRRFPLVGANTGDEPVLPNPNQRISVDEKADAAEHLFLFDVLLAGQDITNSGGEGFINGHGDSVRSYALPQ